MLLSVTAAEAQSPPAPPPLKPLPQLPSAGPAAEPSPPPAAPIVPDVTILPPLPATPVEPPPIAPPPPGLPPSTSPLPPAPSVTPAPPAPAPGTSPSFWNQDVSPRGFSFGLRFQAGFPVGSLYSASGTLVAGATPTNALGDYYGVLFDFTADIGYRLTPHWYVGGFFAIGPATGTTTSCPASHTYCSLNDIRLGAEVKYMNAPTAFINPWVGAGVGWEVANRSLDSGAGNNNGPEIFHLRAGLDFRVNPHLWLGPDVLFTMGLFTHPLGAESSGVDFGVALHDWVMLGLSGHYDL